MGRPEDADQRILAALDAMAATDKEKALTATYGAALSAYLDTFENRMLPLFTTAADRRGASVPETTVRQLDAMLDGLRASAVEPLRLLEDQRMADMDMAGKTFTAVASRAVLVAAVLLVVAIVLALALTLLLSRSITRPLGRGVAFATAVAGGDFSQRLEIGRRDEVGVLAGSLNDMSEPLGVTVARIQRGVELAASARGLSRGAQSQASTLEQTSAAVEQVATVAESGVQASSE